MVLATLVLMAAAAAANDGGASLDSIVVSIIGGIISAGGGIWIGRSSGKSAAEKDWAEKEQKLRAEIANELRTKIVNDPLTIEQTGYQAKMKENDKAHENLFARMAAVEQKLAAVSAKVDAKFDAISEQLRETKAMVTQLFDRICGGKRK